MAPLEVLKSDLCFCCSHSAPRGDVQSNPLALRGQCYTLHRNSLDIPRQGVRVPHIVCRASELVPATCSIHQGRTYPGPHTPSIPAPGWMLTSPEPNSDALQTMWGTRTLWRGCPKSTSTTMNRMSERVGLNISLGADVAAAEAQYPTPEPPVCHQNVRNVGKCR